jgi:hypothetical protein
MSGIALRKQTVCGSVLNWLVPIGYEDEAGFHYGVCSAKGEDGWWNMEHAPKAAPSEGWGSCRPCGKERTVLSGARHLTKQ